MPTGRVTAVVLACTAFLEVGSQCCGNCALLQTSRMSMFVRFAGDERTSTCAGQAGDSAFPPQPYIRPTHYLDIKLNASQLCTPVDRVSTLEACTSSAATTYEDPSTGRPQS